MRFIKRKNESKKSPEQQALEARVDAMMDPKRSDAETSTEVSEPPKKPPKSSTPPPAAADVKTAPRLSATLRKQITVADAGDKPAAEEPPKKPVKQAKTAPKNEATEEPAPEPAEEKPAEAEQSEIAETEDATMQSTDIDDEGVDEAVDDIVRYEGDVMLAVADATADERSREAQEVVRQGHSAGHRVFSVTLWTLVFLVAIIAVVFFVLLVTGANVSGLK